MRRIIVAAILSALSASLAQAQTSPNFTYGQVPTTAAWNQLFASKQDYLGAPPLLVTGGTMTGPLVTLGSSTTTAGFNLPPGSAPTSPNNGDLWTTAGGIFAQINGTTVNLTGAASTSFAGTSPITVSFPSSIVTYACATCGVTGSALSQFAATTSAQLRGVLSDESGTGAALFQNGALGTATGTSLALGGATIGGNALAVTGATSLAAVTVSGAFTIGSTAQTFPGSGLIVGTTDAQSLTNKTLSSSTDVLGGVTMTLGSDANGDLYCRSGGVLTRIAGGASAALLTSSGPTVCPTWVTAPGGGNVSNTGTPISGQRASFTTATTIQGLTTSIVVQTFCPSGCTTTIASGSSGTYTPTAGMTFAEGECVGGGGGGGGITNPGASAAEGSAGGGAGGWSYTLLTAATVGASKAVTIGALGAGGAAGGNNGSAGGDTSIGTLLIAKGASGGATGGLGVAGLGGVAGTGTATSPGMAGMSGAYIHVGGANPFSGFGGSGRFGAGGTGVAANGSTVAGNSGSGWGAGGGGASGQGSTGAAAGGSGTAGFCKITEYINY